MRPTMRQVAERAGVSQVTVTNVLRGRHGRTSTQTRARVLRSVSELGYVPVAQPASQRRHVETKVIGVTFDQIALGQHYSAMNAYLGLSEGAARHGFDLLMMLRPLPDWAPDREEIQFLDRRSDGFIFVAPLRRQGVLETLVEQKIPVVAYSSEDVPNGVGWVVADNRDFVRQAIQYLIARGHRRIAFLDGPEHNSDFRRRGEHFTAMAREGDLKTMRRFCGTDILENSTSSAAGLDALMEWGATAVLCCNDGYALDLWRLAEQRGLRVPHDLSIIGIDGFPEAPTRGLTTVEWDGKGMAVTAVDCWIALLQGADYREQRRFVPGKLVERSSVAALRS